MIFRLDDFQTFYSSLLLTDCLPILRSFMSHFAKNLSEDVELTDEGAQASLAVDLEPASTTLEKNDSSEETQPSTALVPYDSLQRYLAEIRLYPLLTPAEEHELAVRYKEYGDIEAAYQLVTGNLRLVVMIARQYQRAFRNLLDLVQEGNIGLMEAVRNFDPYRGVRFPSYAVWWVRAYIIRYIMNNWRMVKIGTTQAQRKLFFNLQKERERLEAEGFSLSLNCWRKT